MVLSWRVMPTGEAELGLEAPPAPPSAAARRHRAARCSAGLPISFCRRSASPAARASAATGSSAAPALPGSTSSRLPFARGSAFRCLTTRAKARSRRRPSPRPQSTTARGPRRAIRRPCASLSRASNIATGMRAWPCLPAGCSKAGAELLADADLIVPVPLYPARLWWRRFNQSAMLAHGARAALRHRGRLLRAEAGEADGEPGRAQRRPAAPQRRRRLQGRQGACRPRQGQASSW